MKKLSIIILLILSVSQACRISYSTTGASIAPEVKSISIQYIVNRDPNGPPNIEQYFTDKIKDKFKSQTRLTILNDNGQLNIEGEITKITTNQPIAITGSESAAQTRYTITVHVKFTNEVQPEFNFDTSFTEYADYDSGKNLADVEQGIVEEIVDKLIQDIFNKSVVNW